VPGGSLQATVIDDDHVEIKAIALVNIQAGAEMLWSYAL
jgi:hypothetical protein